MLGRGVKYVVPLGIAVLTPSVVFAAESPNLPPPQNRKRTPWDVYCDPLPSKEKDCNKKPAVAELEKCVQKCREEYVGPIQSEAQDYLAQAKSFFKDATSTVVDNVKYLQTGASEDVKMATIAGGSVLGFILGFRKSFFKKLLYAAMGGTATAALIYPKETKVIVKEGSVYAKTTIKSAYNQLVGAAEDKGKDKSEKCDTKPKKPKKDKEGGKNSASTSTVSPDDLKL